MTEEEYRAIEGERWSELRIIGQSPLHYKHAKENPQPDTDAYRFGRIVHAAILEPDAFSSRVVSWSGGVRRGADWEEFKAQLAGRDQTTPAELDTVYRMRDAVMKHRAAAEIIDSTEHEVFNSWTDERTGVKCKRRADMLGVILAADLKTITSTDERVINKAIANFEYHAQSAYYFDQNSIYHRFLIFVEKSAPYDVAVVELSPPDLHIGRQIYCGYLARLAECRRTDTWPGRHPEPIMAQLPGWALPDVDDEITF